MEKRTNMATSGTRGLQRQSLSSERAQRTIKTIETHSVEQLAATLAIIRPAKRHLSGSSWNLIFQEVWIKPTSDEYYFKKAHAFAYAVSVVVHMNLLCEQLSTT